MVHRDLDILAGKGDTITLLGKERPIKRLRVKKYVKSQMLSEKINTLSTLPAKEQDRVIKDVCKLFQTFIPDLTKEEFESLPYNIILGVFEFIDDLFLYDRGYSEDEVQSLKKKLRSAQERGVEQALVNTD